MNRKQKSTNIDSDMKFSKILGPVFPELGWVPTPNYLLRRDLILNELRQLPPGDLLEIGSGAGALLQELSSLGFRCRALESSAEARELIQKISTADLAIHAEPDSAWNENFDYILAFEVLEHIEQDAQALEQWCSWLRPGGALLISVPAHQKHWTIVDEWAGHFRRYDERGLSKKLIDNGFTIVEVFYYGYPLKNLLLPIRKWIVKRALAKAEKRKASSPKARPSAAIARAERTARSGIQKPGLRLYWQFLRIPGSSVFLQIFILLQRCFRHHKNSHGLMILAKKSV